MRIIICDDNLEITNQLKSYLGNYFKQHKLGSPEFSIFHTGDALLADTEAKDIVFLDVEMPGISGIHVGRHLKSENSNVIIFMVTSFTEYLDDAMRFDVFRYLTKPIDKNRLYRNFKDALKKYNNMNAKICIETKVHNHVVNMTDIIMIEVQGRRTIVKTPTNIYDSSQNMKHWINSLPSAYFFRSHRSFLINLHYVDSFDRMQINLYNNQFTAYLTKRKYMEFKENYLLYLESTR